MEQDLIAAIAPFENDLNAMTVEEMKRELTTATGAWKEALSACLQLEKEPADA